MGKWANVLKWTKSAGRGLAPAGNAVLHPQQTLVGAGRALKTATVGAGAAYLGWEALVNDKPVMQTAGDLVFGEETNQSIKEGVSNAVDTVGNTIDTAKGAIDGVTDAVGRVNEATSAWDGAGTFLRNMTGGNASNMFGNLFSNIFSGNVNGMSLLGLVASAFLIFGRFGWLGKIAGAILGMMLIGNNSQRIARNDSVQQEQKPSTTVADGQEQQPRPSIHR